MSNIQHNEQIPSKIFDKWCAELQDKTSMEKKHDKIYMNFYDLFFEMQTASIDADVAFGFLPKAITQHVPPSSVVKTVYKRMKATYSEVEFLQNWKDLIKRKATLAFFDVYPLSQDQQEKIQLPKGTTAKEYLAQRKYAMSFPLISKEDIEKMNAFRAELETEQDLTLEVITGVLSDSSIPRPD